MRNISDKLVNYCHQSRTYLALVNGLDILECPQIFLTTHIQYESYRNGSTFDHVSEILHDVTNKDL